LKILLVAQEAALQSREIVSGNAIRIDQLCSALQHAGHEVIHVWLARPDQDAAAAGGSFRNRDELHGIILATVPDVILLAYWELAALLPFELQQPVVLDFVAPRPLEELFEHPQRVRSNLRRLRNHLQRCDLILVGNEQQRHLLINNLIEAGFDLRQNVPVMVVPLGAAAMGPPKSSPGPGGWLLVTGGVSWPWRNAQTYLQALASAAQKNALPVKIVQFDGTYRWHDPSRAPAAGRTDTPFPAIERRTLQPYQQFSAFLTSQAHIGVELADWNIERAYSQSFRALEFLRHGLPVLCNHYLPQAPLIETYNAGWVLDTPDQLEDLLAAITAAPGEWHNKSAGALRLVTEVLQPDRSVSPLIAWLAAPAHAPRLPAETRDSSGQPAVLGVPPWRQRWRRQYRLVKQVGLRRLFGQRKAGQGVLLVTRGDLFPADHGAAVRIVETARALARSGLAVGIVTDQHACWYEYADGDFRRRRFPFWVHLFSAPAPLLKLLHYSKDLPHSNGFLYLAMTDGGFFWRTLAAARKIHAGILQAEFPAYAQPCIEARELLDCRVVMVEHNVEYERLRMQVDELTDAQYRNLRHIELSLCQQSDAVVCVSDNDRQKLVEDGVRPDLLHTISHGVNLADYKAAAMPGIRHRFKVGDEEVLLLYHGTFSYPPNRQALQVFADILLPGLEHRGLSCHVLAVGRDPPAGSPHDRIHFTGSVTELAACLKAADLAVIPLTDGGGTRMKIIDCFAAGLPVISTRKGIEGIPIEPGRHALVIDDWDEMMDAIVKLWRDPPRRAALADAAAGMAAGLDWSAIAARYRSIYSSLR
jgi:glycosyltransferase involved in cell wall biosynthesis